jgi:hypothetical protein
MVTALEHDHTSYLFRGNNTASTQEYQLSTLDTGARALYLIGAGVGGDTVLYQNFPSEFLLYADTAGTLQQPSPTTGDIDVFFYGNRYPGNSRAVALRADDPNHDGHTYLSADYRGTVAPTLVRAALSTKAPPAITADERLLIATSTGILEITDPFGSPSEQVVAMSGSVVNWLHCDAQSRTLVAGIASNVVDVWNSTTGDVVIIDITALSNEWQYIHVVTEV